VLLGEGGVAEDAVTILEQHLAPPFGVYQLDPRAYPHKDTYDPELPFGQYMLFHLVGHLSGGREALTGCLKKIAAKPQAAVYCVNPATGVQFSFAAHPALARGWRHAAERDSTDKTPEVLPKKITLKASVSLHDDDDL
jgi:hypothetical protein